jgi:hypothetical protein
LPWSFVLRPAYAGKSVNQIMNRGMKKVIALMLPLLLGAAVVAGVALTEARRPRDWQAALDAYLQEQGGPGRLQVQATAWARQPGRFERDMSRAVFGGDGRGEADLPFPPEAVWCVLLKRDPSGRQDELPYQVLFVAHHVDPPWYDEWLVHVGSGNPFAPDFAAGLRAIGCELGLEEREPGDIQPVVQSPGAEAPG